MALVTRTNFAPSNDVRATNSRSSLRERLPNLVLSTTPVQPGGSLIYNVSNKTIYYSDGLAWLPIYTGSTTGTVTLINTGTGLTGGPITTTGTISIANTAVTAGSYTYSSITVNAQGQITSATSGAAPVTSVTAGTGISVTGTSSAPIVNIANTTVTAGAYTAANITVNAQGQITAATNGSSGVTSVTAGTGISLTGTATAPIVNIANTTVTAGSYTSPNITVNAQGQITAAVSTVASGFIYGSIYGISGTAGAPDYGSTIAALNPIPIPNNTAFSAGVSRVDAFSIRFTSQGTYWVVFQACISEAAAQIALYINDNGGVGAYTAVDPSRVGKTAATSQLVILSTVFFASPNGTLRVYNDSAGPITITPNSGGANPVGVSLQAFLLEGGGS